MEYFNLQISKQEMKEIALKHFNAKIESEFSKASPLFEKAFESFFNQKDWTIRSERFNDGYDWAIEQATREGIQKAIKELNLTELIYQEAMKIMSDGEFIKEMAKDKIKSILKLD